MKVLVALAFLAAHFYVYHYYATEEVFPSRHSFQEFPLALEDWHCDAPEEIREDVLENLGVTDWLACSYTRGSDDLVHVYVGYHESQVRREGGGASGASIHPPKHCLPGSGWDIIQHEREELSFPGLPGGSASVNKLVIAKGESRQLVYYWYQSRGRVIADDTEKIVYLFLDRARKRRTDGSLVRFTVPMRHGDMKQAEAAFHDLAPRIVARLPDFVPN